MKCFICRWFVIQFQTAYGRMTAKKALIHLVFSKGFAFAAAAAVATLVTHI
jgi:hypothetical protein